MVSSPLEKAILGISKTGRTLQGLSKSPFNCAKPWSCDLVPGHLGRYHWGEKSKTGIWSVYPNSQTRIVADGNTPLEAIQAALAALDKSPAKKVYSNLERALGELLHEHTKGTRDQSGD